MLRITSKFNGSCSNCGCEYEIGEAIFWKPGGSKSVRCLECGPGEGGETVVEKKKIYSIKALRKEVRERQSTLAIEAPGAFQESIFEFFESVSATRLQIAESEFWGYEDSELYSGRYYATVLSNGKTVFEGEAVVFEEEVLGATGVESPARSDIAAWQNSHEAQYNRLQAEIDRFDQRAQMAEHVARILREENTKITTERDALAEQVWKGTLMTTTNGNGIAAPTEGSGINLAAEMENGAWQAGAHEAAKRTRAVLLAQLKKAKAGSMVVEGVRVFVNSEWGLAVWSFLLGMMLPYIPKAKNMPHVQRMGEELRTGGFRTAFGAMADKIVDAVASVVNIVDVTDKVTRELGVGTVGMNGQTQRTNGVGVKVNGVNGAASHG